MKGLSANLCVIALLALSGCTSVPVVATTSKGETFTGTASAGLFARQQLQQGRAVATGSRLDI